jgi:nitrogen fixation-related uncharacterized protein
VSQTTILLYVMGAIVLLLILIGMFGTWAIDVMFPDEDAEKNRALRDVEKLLKRANVEAAHRPRVKAKTRAFQPNRKTL